MAGDTYLVLRVTGFEGEVLGPVAEFGVRAVKQPGEKPPVTFEVTAAALDHGDLKELNRDPNVKAMAQPIPLSLIAPVAAGETGPAPIRDVTWGVAATGAPESPCVGRGVTVAVLDTGIDAGHAAFQGVELVQKDFTGTGDGDQHGHGTHVAGTIFGQTVDGVRYSVAPGVRRALIGKVLGGDATTAELVDAIQWAVGEGAHVINMSLGFDFPGLVQKWVDGGMPADLATSRALAQYRDNVRFFDKLIELVRARAVQYSGALVVAAAGNESHREIKPEYTIEVAPPAAANGVMAVAALQPGDIEYKALEVARFSNIRATVAAPGVGVYSARAGGGFTYMDGTSMASPHVTGVAALWAEQQLNRNGMVDLDSLSARIRGSSRTDCLPGASYLDVGDGLVAAPKA